MAMATTNKKKEQKTPCAHCGDTDSPVSACSRCKLVVYCSVSCQKADWKKPNGHKGNCIPIEKRKPQNIPNRSTLHTKEMCSICLDEVNIKIDWKLPCSHVFHKSCITEMMDKNKKLLSCPNCRQEVGEIHFTPPSLSVHTHSAQLFLFSMYDLFYI